MIVPFFIIIAMLACGIMILIFFYYSLLASVWSFLHLAILASPLTLSHSPHLTTPTSPHFSSTPRHRDQLQWQSLGRIRGGHTTSWPEDDSEEKESVDAGAAAQTAAGT